MHLLPGRQGIAHVVATRLSLNWVWLKCGRKMARLAVDYHREFDVVPRFRAGLHAGPVIVSE